MQYFNYRYLKEGIKIKDLPLIPSFIPLAIYGQGHCFTITETTQTFTKVPITNLRLTLFFRPNVSISKVLCCFSFGETVTCNSNLQPATCSLHRPASVHHS